MTTRAASFVPALLATLLLGAAAPAGASAPLEPVLRVNAGVPQPALDAGLKGKVVLQVRVARAGYVDSVRVTSGDARLRAAASSAARWTMYSPQPASVWTPLTYDFDGTVEAEPLQPDLLAMAHDAEAAGDWRNVLDAWTGALARLGSHPALANEWAIREQVVRAAKHMKPYPVAPGDTQGSARGSRSHQERVVARAQHEDLVVAFDKALKDAPWWGEPYLWRAASLAGCGRSTEAVRSVRFYLGCNPDSAGTALAHRALALFASGDSLMASETIKKHALRFNKDE